MKSGAEFPSASQCGSESVSVRNYFICFFGARKISLFLNLIMIDKQRNVISFYPSA